MVRQIDTRLGAWLVLKRIGSLQSDVRYELLLFLLLFSREQGTWPDTFCLAAHGSLRVCPPRGQRPNSKNSYKKWACEVCLSLSRRNLRFGEGLWDLFWVKTCRELRETSPLQMHVNSQLVNPCQLTLSISWVPVPELDTL